MNAGKNNKNNSFGEGKKKINDFPFEILVFALIMLNSVSMDSKTGSTGHGLNELNSHYSFG